MVTPFISNEQTESTYKLSSAQDGVTNEFTGADLHGLLVASHCIYDEI
jgi:hypothetical protein